MGFARTLETENEMRALMNVQTLNEMLSVYCGMEGTRNCLLICHQVSAAAPGQGPDRSRLFHRKQVAVAFRYQRRQWWFGDAAKPCWYPTLGEHGGVPPLEALSLQPRPLHTLLDNQAAQCLTQFGVDWPCLSAAVVGRA